MSRPRRKPAVGRAVLSVVVHASLVVAGAVLALLFFPRPAIAHLPRPAPPGPVTAVSSPDSPHDG
jgi:hypothetical protein